MKSRWSGRTATTDKYDMKFNILTQKQSMDASALAVISKIFEMCETRNGRIERHSIRQSIVDVDTKEL